MTEVREGDTVRVVLEGTALDVTATQLKIGLSGQRNAILRAAQHVKSVEVLERVKREYVVGDSIKGDEYLELPVGTIAREAHGTPIIKVDEKNWTFILPGRLRPGHYEGSKDGGFSDPRTIEYLPTR